MNRKRLIVSFIGSLVLFGAPNSHGAVALTPLAHAVVNFLFDFGHANERVAAFNSLYPIQLQVSPAGLPDPMVGVSMLLSPAKRR